MTDNAGHDLDPESGLTRKQRLFCDQYLTHLNPRLAYAQAGYTSANPDTARKDANALLNQPDVRSWLDLKMKERADRLGVQADRVLLEAAILAYSSVGDYRVNEEAGTIEVRPGVPVEALRAVRAVKVTRRAVTRGRGEAARTETTVTTEVQLWDKGKALHLLCLHLGLVSAELPPLEVLLNRLPPPVAGILRQLLATPPGQRPPLPLSADEEAAGRPPATSE